MKNLFFLIALLFVIGMYSCTDGIINDSVQNEQYEIRQNSKISSDILSYISIERIEEFNLQDLNIINERISQLKDFRANEKSHKTKWIGAGSVDRLQSAIEEVGHGGIVYLASGIHKESNPITISNNVSLIGQDGATIISDVSPIETKGGLDPALFIYNSNDVLILNINFVSKSDPGGTGILVHNSPRTVISTNSFTNFSLSIVIDAYERCYVLGNTIKSTLAWATGEILDAYGITIVNGPGSRVIMNTITDAFVGIWPCDKNGISLMNTTNDNYLGHLLCKVPEESFLIPSGTKIGARHSATSWKVSYNVANNNFSTGYLIIDGASHNYLSSNTASGNGEYDIELAGVSERFGFTTPRSEYNRVFGKPTMKIKDCGFENEVIGGNLVDNNEDPCY